MSTSTDHDSIESIVIVGAGEAGTGAALALRALGFANRITLVEADRSGPVYRPAMSKLAFLQRGDDDSLQRAAKMNALEQAQVELLTDVVVESVAAGRDVIELSSGGSLGYQRLLLAVGSRPRRLDLAGAECIEYLRTPADAERLRGLLSKQQRVAVIGGGLIGLEMAASARTMGCQVVVLEAADALMSRAMPGPVAQVLAERHTAEGVSVRLSVRIAGLEPSAGGPVAITLETGEVIECDCVLGGVGTVPNTDLAVDAGLGVDNGIVTDDMFQTTRAGIFAAGDCCNAPHPLVADLRLRGESWRVAKGQGAAAAASMLNGTAPVAMVPWYWTDQYDLSAQVAGVPSVASETVRRSRADGIDLYFGLDSTGQLISVAGVGPAGSVGKDVRLTERLIAAGTAPSADSLADPDVTLKSIIASHSA